MRPWRDPTFSAKPGAFGRRPDALLVNVARGPVVVMCCCDAYDMCHRMVVLEALYEQVPDLMIENPEKPDDGQMTLW